MRIGRFDFPAKRKHAPLVKDAEVLLRFQIEAAERKAAAFYIIKAGELRIIVTAAPWFARIIAPVVLDKAAALKKIRLCLDSRSRRFGENLVGRDEAVIPPRPNIHHQITSDDSQAQMLDWFHTGCRLKRSFFQTEGAASVFRRVWTWPIVVQARIISVNNKKIG